MFTKKNSCCSKIPLPKSPSFNIYLQLQMVNKALNLVYLTLISTYPSCKTKKGHSRHLHAEVQSEIIQRRNHFENNSARYFGYKKIKSVLDISEQGLAIKLGVPV